MKHVVSAIATLLLAGCSNPEPPAPVPATTTAPAPLPDNAVCILAPLSTDRSGDAAMKLLTETFPAASVISVLEAERAFAECRAQNRVLIIPAIRNFPQHLWRPLTNSLRAGNPVVFLGTDPFAHRVRILDAQAQPEAELTGQLIAAARRFDQEWTHENDSGKPLDGARALTNQSWSGAEVTVHNLRDWDALVAGNLHITNANTLVLQAFGDANTSRLAVVCAEADGSHWYRVVPLTTEWQPHVLHEAMFDYFYGGWNRGKPGDRLSLAKVRRMTLGLSMHLGAQSPGTHVFGVSEVRAANDPRPPAEVADWPDIPLLSPPYRHYDLNVGQQRMQSPLARARGDGAPYIWQPLATTKGKDGVALGWPASLYFEPPGRRHAWIAMEPNAANSRVIAGFLRDAVTRLQSPPYVREDGTYVPSSRTSTNLDWVTTNAGYFTYRGKRIFFRGINYWPLSHNGKAPGEFDAHWLEPAAFDPEIVRRDLDRLREVGINAVSIQYNAESQARPLWWFVDECRQRGIWVHAFVGYLQPLEQDLAKAERLIRAAELWNEPGIFAIDVAWEPHLGGYDARCRFDTDWEAWLVEQYGSVDRAEEKIGRPLWSRDGHVTGPTDEELRTDGSHRVAVAAYRRFVDDFMSRRYGEVARLVRRLGCRQLLSARSGFGGTGNPWADAQFPIDLTTGAVHFDFISPEGYALTGDRDQFDEAGFLTAYARGVAAGKPVAWLEFGCNVGRDPSPVDLANQARLYRQMFDFAARSRAAGVFGWWYPGGWRVDERSDFGVVNPDGTWRPVGDEFRQFAQNVGNNLLPVAPWRGREFDRDADARGLSALWNKWRDTYRLETRENRIEEIRPLHFGQPASEFPASANAEWGRVEVNGAEFIARPVRARVGDKILAELINTGPVTWDKVSVASRPLASAPYAYRVWIPVTAAAGATRLRPVLDGFGEFGQPLNIEIIP